MVHAGDRLSGVRTHTERFRVDIVETGEEEPSVRTDAKAMRLLVAWPRSLPVSDFVRQPDVGEFLMRVVFEVMAATFVLPELEHTMERLAVKGSAHDRGSSVLASLSALHRIVGRPVVRLDRAAKDYPMRDRPTGADIERPATGDDDEEVLTRQKSGDGHPTVRGHRGMKVQSVIDVDSGDEARRKGILYVNYGADVSPSFALTFINPVQRSLARLTEPIKPQGRCPLLADCVEKLQKPRW